MNAKPPSKNPKRTFQEAFHSCSEAFGPVQGFLIDNADCVDLIVTAISEKRVSWLLFLLLLGLLLGLEQLDKNENKSKRTLNRACCYPSSVLGKKMYKVSPKVCKRPHRRTSASPRKTRKTATTLIHLNASVNYQADLYNRVVVRLDAYLRSMHPHLSNFVEGHTGNSPEKVHTPVVHTHDIYIGWWHGSETVLPVRLCQTSSPACHVDVVHHADTVLNEDDSRALSPTTGPHTFHLIESALGTGTERGALSVPTTTISRDSRDPVDRRAVGEKQCFRVFVPIDTYINFI